MTSWIEPAPPLPGAAALHAAIGGHPLVAQTLARRGITAPAQARAFLDPAHYSPTPPGELPGLARAVELLQDAIGAGQPILVWGDFDVDGQTSTTLLVEALRSLGAVVHYHIPVRATEGHGVKKEVLEEILAAKQTALLLTCDTGIAAHEAVNFAKSRRLTVVITDHHDLPAELPAADAIVNPKLLPADHPLSTLAGVGVAYKLVEALFADQPQRTDRLLDLVVLGLVADVALLTGDTRYLVQRGLRALRRTTRPGLHALFRNAGLIPDQLNEEHIGFAIAPRLNALGRLGDANPVVEFLTTDDLGRAAVLAAQLEGLNQKRRLLSDQIYQAALAQIEQHPELLDYAAVVLSHPQWAPGVIGIVASRLVERFHKPVVLLAAPEDGPARGSARSIEGVHITAAIASQAEMLLGFGGHPMAAGLSLPAERIADFRRGLSRAIRQRHPELPERPALPLAAYLDLDQLDLALVDEIERLAPFGAGNPPLVFASREVHIANQHAIGRDGRHLRLVVEDATGNAAEVLWWRGATERQPQGRFDLAYTLRANTFRGERRVQLEWLDFRPSAGAPVEVIPEAPRRVIIDRRGEAEPLAALERIRAEGEVQIYAEGEARRRVGGRARFELTAMPRLVLWSAPPGPREWTAILAAADPQIVYLFAVDPGLDAPEAFLERLAGLVKHALRTRQGRVGLEELAAAMAHREETVRLGLAWLEERGHITIAAENEGEIRIQAGGKPGHALNDIAVTLKAALDETAAYRAYLARAAPDALL